jgi:hypothetical protein
MEQFPSYRYRDNQSADGGVEARLVHSAADEAALPTDLGPWRHSPNPDALPSVDPATLAFRPSTGAVVAFPSYRYRLFNGQLESRLVQDQAESDALAAEGWIDAPAGDGASAPASTPAMAGRTSTFDPNVTSAPLSPEDEAAASRDLYAAKPADVIASVVGITDTDVLLRIHAREQANPKGPRQKILKAVNARMNELLEKADEPPQG